MSDTTAKDREKQSEGAKASVVAEFVEPWADAREHAVRIRIFAKLEEFGQLDSDTACSAWCELHQIHKLRRAIRKVQEEGSRATKRLLSNVEE